MGTIVNLQIAIDTQSLIAAYPKLSRLPKKPTIVANSYCCMIGAAGLASQGQATDWLTVTASSADDASSIAIRWRAISLSGNSGTAAVIYDIRSAPHTESSPDADAPLPILRPAKSYLTAADAPLPVLEEGRNTDPPSFAVEEVEDFYLQAAVLRPGTADLQIRFYVTTQDDQTGKPVLAGYLEWRTVLTVR